MTLEVLGGRYAGAAHVRALGKPHLGPQTPDNVICLCPNDHILFDRGAIWVDEDWRVQPSGTPLLDHQLNAIDPAHVRYHRETRAQKGQLPAHLNGRPESRVPLHREALATSWWRRPLWIDQRQRAVRRRDRVARRRPPLAQQHAEVNAIHGLVEVEVGIERQPL